MNSKEIESALVYAAFSHKESTELKILPEKTHNGKVSRYIKITNKASILPNKIGVYMIAGIHGLEWVPPDALIYFMEKLLESNVNGEIQKIVIGDNTFSVGEVSKIFDKLILYIFPLVNPDGREISQSDPRDLERRKNARPSSSSELNLKFGVDINRNFDFLWNYESLFSSRADLKFVSNYPFSKYYSGPYPNSEPETKNVISVLFYNKGIEYFVDIHSFNMEKNYFLYCWSHSKSQYVKPNRISFRNGWNLLGDGSYEEFVDGEDYKLRQGLAKKMCESANVISMNRYKYQTTREMYIMPGCSRDYFESRDTTPGINYINGSKKIHSFMIESSVCALFPNEDERKTQIEEISSALFKFCIEVSK